MTNLRIRIATAVRRLRYTEPALLRAHVVAALALAAGLGVTIPGVVNTWVGIVFTALAIAAPYYQGQRTRADVWSPKTVDDLMALVHAFPGLAEEAQRLLGKGISPGIVRESLEQLLAQQPTAPTA